MSKVASPKYASRLPRRSRRRRRRQHKKTRSTTSSHISRWRSLPCNHLAARQLCPLTPPRLAKLLQCACRRMRLRIWPLRCGASYKISTIYEHSSTQHGRNMPEAKCHLSLPQSASTPVSLQCVKRTQISSRRILLSASTGTFMTFSSCALSCSPDWQP